MELLQSLLMIHACRSSLLTMLRQILLVMQSTSTPELADTLLSLYRTALQVSADYHGALALALVPGDSECLSIYSRGALLVKDSGTSAPAW